jgi:hypothetical protein
MKNINAMVTYDWKHKNHKFMPLDTVKVSYVNEAEPYTLKSRVGQEGTILARSTTKYGTARVPYCGTERQWTRYYVVFNDGEVNGFYSWYLNKV